MGADVKVEKSFNEVLLYDGVCKFCNGSVNFIIKHEKKSSLKFSPLQSTLSKKLSKDLNFDVDQLNTLIFIHTGKVYTKSKAVFKVSSYLKFPWNALSILNFLPTKLTDFFYDFIAKKRYVFFGREDECIVPDPEIRYRFLD